MDYIVWDEYPTALFGYVTQVADECGLSNCELEDLCNRMLELGFCDLDLCNNANTGKIGDRAVCIDFGESSISPNYERG
jgi:hypothetical protein